MFHFTVAVDAKGIGPKQLAKVIAYRDGGFGLVPLYAVDPGLGTLLVETPAAYDAPGFLVHQQSMYREYRSSHPVKLSIHGSGFVQFSRAGTNGVISGKDPLTRRARGFGYQSPPPTNPPRSGPMFAMTAWGLGEYGDYHGPGKHSILMGPDDIYSAQPGAPGLSGYALEFWPLPRYALPSARLHGGLVKLTNPPHRYYNNKPFDFTVLDVGNPLMILGLVVTRFAPEWATPSGMTLSGPSDLSQRKALFAVSPIPQSGSFSSADYQEVSSQGLKEGSALLLPVTRIWDDRG
jgi:hypothetical protein